MKFKGEESVGGLKAEINWSWKNPHRRRLADQQNVQHPRHLEILTQQSPVKIIIHPVRITQQHTFDLDEYKEHERENG